MATERTPEEEISLLHQIRGKTCYECNEYMSVRSRASPWRWGRCRAKGLDARDMPVVEIDSTAFSGGAKFCPLGKWAKLKIADMAAINAANAEAQARKLIEFTRTIVARLPEPQKDNFYAALDDAVTEGTIPPGKVVEVKRILDAELSKGA